MKRARRNVLLVLAGLGASATGIGAIGIAPGAVGNYALEVIEEVFGADVARHRAAHEFAEAYDGFVRAKGTEGLAANAVFRFGLEDLPPVRGRSNALKERIILRFATSTNVVLASEQGTELEFMGLFVPRVTPCMNQLGALALV